MRKFVLSICAVLMCGLAVAQNVRVSGTISDSDGHALIGASVEVKGNANLGTVALDGGEYTISVPSSATLIFSYMGMVPQEIAVGGRTKIDVVMVADAHQVQDVVVIGYGSGVAAESVVGSVSIVASQKLANTPVANVADVLQGKIPGMQVYTDSGEPTAGATMFVRGVSSMNADTDPLYILDGTPVSSTVFRALNANDIESITLLKDAASTSIYGSRAANGVLYITTKKGRTGMEPVIKVQYQGGFSSMVENKKFELMNSAEQIQFEEMLYPHLLTDPAWLTKKEYILRNNFNFDWKGYAYSQNAGVTGIDASVTGATNNTTYYISAGYLDTEGIAPRSNNTRYSFRTNLDAKIRDWFKMGTNINLAYSDYLTSVTGWYTQSVDGLVYGQAPYNAPYEMIFKEDGTIELGEELDKFPFAGNMYNPYYYYEKFPNSNNRVNLSGSLYEEITPIEGLTLRATQAIDAYDTRQSANRLPSYAGNLGNGSATEYFYRYYQLTSSNTAEYKFDLGDNHFTFLAGHESIVAHGNGFEAYIQGLTDDRLLLFGAGTASTAEVGSHSKVDEVSNSFFGRVNYAYGNRYHFDASLRTDGSSKFGRNARWATFWSVGGMWNIKNEDFMLNADKVNDLRLRLSYGTTGNSGIGNYIAYGTIGTGPNYNGAAGTTIGNPANHDLTWETVTTANLGVTARLFNRASVEVDVYNRVTSNMLMDVPYSAATGYSSGWGNVGKLSNTGFELQASYDLVQRPDMLWTVYGNVAYNHNEILELYNGIQEFVDGGTGLKYAVGHAVGEFTGVHFSRVDPRDGMPIWLDKNGNETKQYSDSNENWLNMNYNADWSGGFGTSFTWKGFTASADFSWVGDRYMWLNEKFYTANLNFGSVGQTRYEKRLLNMWQKPGDITDIPKAGTKFNFDSTVYSNAAFLRLKNVTLSYNVPEYLLDKTGFVKGARIFAIGRNLLTFTNYLGFDPEHFGNGSKGTYPGTRQYTFGVELTF